MVGKEKEKVAYSPIIIYLVLDLVFRYLHSAIVESSCVPIPMNCVTHYGSYFSMLWPAIIQIGHVTMGVIRGMGVTQFLTVGHVSS